MLLDYSKAPDVERAVRKMLGEDEKPPEDKGEQAARIAGGTLKFFVALTAGLSGIFGK